MTATVVFCLLFLCAVCVSGFGDNMLGPGKWSVINIRKCPDREISVFDCDIVMHKINRTHSGFNANIKLHERLDESIAIRVESCKRMDGGCKPYLTLTDNSFIHFVDQYVAMNAKKLLTLAEVDPPTFPLEAGEYVALDFIFDFNELPINCLYGEFIAQCIILKDFMEVGCIETVLEFKEEHDDDGGEDYGE